KRPDWMKLKIEFQAAEKAKKQATTSHRRERAAWMEEESELEESAKMASQSSSSAASVKSATGVEGNRPRIFTVNTVEGEYGLVVIEQLTAPRAVELKI
ncbi:hypothetical protein FRB96_006237, partial [Tulasnella sp. 330]